MGFDLDRFPDVNHELICCICTGLLEDPIESPCRHVFCSKCVRTWLSSNKSCPSCRAAVRRRDLKQVVPMLKNIISKQRIYCDNRTKGCQEIVELELLSGHVANCKFGDMTCENEGCNAVLLRKDYNNHGEICPKRMIVCDRGCETFMTYGERERHNCMEAIKSHFQTVTNELQARISKLEEVISHMPGANDLLSNNFNDQGFEQPYVASPCQSVSCQEINSYGSDEHDDDSDHRRGRGSYSPGSSITETSPRLAFRSSRRHDWRRITDPSQEYRTEFDRFRERVEESRSRSRSPVFRNNGNRERGRRSDNTWNTGPFGNRNQEILVSASNSDSSNSISNSDSEEYY